MTKPSYPALFHFIHLAIADVDFPCTKEELLRKTQGRTVHTDWEAEAPLADFVQPVESREFSCAADFYCKLIASM